jgi:hypothetical protein
MDGSGSSGAVTKILGSTGAEEASGASGVETAISSGCDPEESDESEELEDELEEAPAAEEDELDDELLLLEESLKCRFLNDFSAVASPAELTWEGRTSGVTGGSMVGDSIGAS